jgi:hypothetical protein
MAEIGASADAAWNVGAIDALREAVRTQGEKTGVRWADALSISVRPVITYWFMALYCAAKTAAFRGCRDRWRWLGHGHPACLDGSRSGAVGRGAELLVPRARV